MRAKEENVKIVCEHKDEAKCSACRINIIGLSFFTNIVSVILKGFIGILSGSQALIADALHSLTDTASLGLNYSNVRKSSSSNNNMSLHMNVVIGAITFLTGVWLCGHNMFILILGQSTHPGLFGLVLAALSCVVNWYLYTRAKCANEQYKDMNIFICVVQNRTNFSAATMAFFGILAADLGFMFFDPLIAVAIGCLMIAAAFELFGEIFAEITPVKVQVKSIAFTSIGVISTVIVVFFAYSTYKALDRMNVILIPALDQEINSPADTVLGRAVYFLVINKKDNTVTPILNKDIYYKGDVSHNIVEIVEEYGVGTVIAKRIGQEIFSDLRALDIKIYYFDKPNQTIKDVFNDYKRKRLKTAQAANVDRGFGRSKIRWLQPW